LRAAARKQRAKGPGRGSGPCLCASAFAACPGLRALRRVLERVVVVRSQAFTVRFGDAGTPVRVPIHLLNERPL